MIAFLPYNTLVVLIGVSLLGLSAGLIGVFALLRRRALLGDATAHAGLPGVCIAFMLAGERSMPLLLTGALVAGLVGLGVLSALRQWTRIKEDAALALVLSVFYALGIVLLSIILKGWPGAGASGLNSFLWGTTAGMSREDVFWIAGLSLFTILSVAVLYKEMKLVAFDADFAHTQGWPVFALDYFLNLLVVVAVVVGLPAVGVVMMAALLVIPAAAARFWTNRLSTLLLLAGAFGLIGTSAGAMISAEMHKVAAGPAIILACTFLFLVSLFLGTSRGLLARWEAHRRFQARLARHQGLTRLHAWMQDRQTDHIADAEAARVLGTGGGFLRQAVSENWLKREGPDWTISPVGRQLAEEAAQRQETAQRYLHRHPELAASLAQWFLTDETLLPGEAHAHDG